MCGRAYSTYTDEELHLRYLSNRRAELPPIQPTFNFAPTQESLILRLLNGERHFSMMRWGLVPPWEKEFKTKLSTINARAETLFKSNLYKGPALKQRCIVPLSGFFEWKRVGDHKRPFCIRMKNEPVMSIAGVWDVWRQQGQEKYSFSIVTTSANALMEKIHDRMPVILAREDEETWLDPELQDVPKLESLLKPCPPEWLEAYEVSTAVNSPRNNSKELLNPLTGEIHD